MARMSNRDRIARAAAEAEAAQAEKDAHRHLAAARKEAKRGPVTKAEAGTQQPAARAKPKSVSLTR